MNNVTHFEDRASRSRSRHEGESSSSLCDRLSRTRDVSQRQLPTNQDYAVSTREYQTDQSSLTSAPTAAGPVFEKQQKQPHGFAVLTRSLHIREGLSTIRPEPRFLFPTTPLLGSDRQITALRARINLPPNRESAEIADQDYVAALIAFGEQQLLAAAGPGEIENTAGGKVRDLPRRSAG